MPIRTIFFGTPEFSLPTLHALMQSSEIEVTGIVTRPDKPAGRGKKLQPPPVKLAAMEYSLAIAQPASLKKDEQILDWLRERSPNVMVVVAYGGFIPEPIRTLAPWGCVNLHPSLLPKYRGAAPMQRAILDGNTVTGNSTMYLSEGWDDGDVIYQEEEPIRPNDTYGTLSERLAEKGGRLIVRSLIDIAQGCAPRTVQNHNQAVMAPMIQNEDARIDWNRPAKDIHNHIRGLNPDPGAYTVYQGTRWKLLRSEVLDETPGSPGTIAGTEFNTIRVHTGDGVIEILELQPAGKKPMTAAAFLRGMTIPAGTPFDPPANE